MSDDDYRVAPLQDFEIREIASKVRRFIGAADAERLEVLDLEQVDKIWTIKGIMPFRLETVPDSKLPGDAGRTFYDGTRIIAQITRHVRHNAYMGEGYARNTISHEIGHAVMHFDHLSQGASMPRRLSAQAIPGWIEPFRSAEHHAKVFAVAFLVHGKIAPTLPSAEEISVRFGISLESAKIEFKRLQEEKDRPAAAARVLSLAQDLKGRLAPKPRSVPTFLNDPCSKCGERTVFPVGAKFMCKTCEYVSDSFQDGD
jgi:Zn-dependent peptidase ImmA (M78 family)